MCVCVCVGGGGGGGGVRVGGEVVHGCNGSAMSGCALTLLYLLMVSPVMTMLHGQSTCERSRNQYPFSHLHTHTSTPPTPTHHPHPHTTHTLTLYLNSKNSRASTAVERIRLLAKDILILLTHLQDMQANHLMAVLGIYTYTGSESASIRSDYVLLSSAYSESSLQWAGT